MLQSNIALMRIILLGLFVCLAVVYAFDQYGLARDTVRFICISCLGLGG